MAAPSPSPSDTYGRKESMEAKLVSQERRRGDALRRCREIAAVKAKTAKPTRGESHGLFGHWLTDHWLIDHWFIDYMGLVHFPLAH